MTRSMMADCSSRASETRLTGLDVAGSGLSFFQERWFEGLGPRSFNTVDNLWKRLERRDTNTIHQCPAGSPCRRRRCSPMGLEQFSHSWYLVLSRFQYRCRKTTSSLE